MPLLAILNSRSKCDKFKHKKSEVNCEIIYLTLRRKKGKRE
jgi:hypothetical protein